MGKSVFDLDEQNSEISSKIVVTLERISEAFRVLLWNQGKEFGLSPIQVQLLIFIHLHDQKYCKVSYLAQEFSLTKATISDAIKTLTKKELVEKIPETRDSRSFTIQTTDQGEQLTQRLLLFSNALKTPIEKMEAQQKQELWQSLMTIALALQRAGIITLQRMCFNCANYRNNNGTHFCQLLQLNLEQQDIRVDCPEHQNIP